ncbi:MAG: guanylate kinase [Deltaproteobacteria bacterium]|nr:guanylate kinase [Deltaproteobacteria bacterium]
MSNSRKASPSSRKASNPQSRKASNPQSRQEKSSRGKLVVLSAPSGAGKSTIAGLLLRKHHDRFELSISYTTRTPRGAEKHGVHYFFVAEPEFRKMAAENGFLECAHVFGKYWYGTSRKFVEDILARGKNVLFDIDVQGADQLKHAYGKNCVTVFILPPSMEELESRLRGRKTETAEAIEFRLETARKEMAASPRFDHRIRNVKLEDAFAELEAVLKQDGCL